MSQNFFPNLILSIFQNRMEAIQPKGLKITLEEIDFETLKEHVDEIDIGFLAKSYGKTETPKIITLIFHAKLEPKVFRNILGSLGILSFWEHTFDLFQLWNKMGNSIVNLFQCNEIHQLTENNRKEALYQMANYRTFIIKFNETILYIGIERGLSDSIEQSIKNENEIREFVTSIEGEYAKQNAIKKIYPKLQIERQREFIIGNFLIPRNFIWGNMTVITRVKYIRETHIKDAEELAFWFGLSLSYDKSYYLQYGFPHQKMDHPEDLQTKYQGLLVHIIKPILALKWNHLSVPLQKSGSKFLDKPILPLFDKGVLVEYEIRINQSILISHVIVPKTLVDFLMSIESHNQIFESSEPLLHFINLNRKWISEHYSDPFKVYFQQIENRKFPILLMEFISMINDADLLLTIQNYFVASGIKTIDLQRLFFYVKTDPSNGEKTLTLDEDFEEGRVKSLLPAGMQKEWENFPVHLENRTGLASISYPYDEFINKNREIMQNIYDASKSGKIQYSAQTRYILFSEFEKLIREELENQLTKINAESLSLFTKLKNVPKANLQQFFYSLKSDELGSIFISWDKELPKIQPFVSKQFYQEVSEDLKAKNLLYQNLNLDLRNVVVLKEKFASELSALTSEEFV